MARNKVDKLLIIDTEATCKRDDSIWTKTQGELIEIAIVPIDLRSHEIRRDLEMQAYVKNIDTEINGYCEELTGITQELIDSAGSPAHEVFNRIRNEFSYNIAWAGWGEFDRDLIERTAKKVGVTSPFGHTYYNLKHFYSLLKGSRKMFGVQAALQNEGLQFDGTPHRAICDAYNEARIIVKLMKEKIWI